MTKRMLIDATHAEETRVVVLDGNRLEDFDVETSTKRQLKGNIYLAKVVRVEPSLQACFVEYGGNRHGFLAFSEIHPDYYQIPVADRQRLIDMQEEEAREEEEEADREMEGRPEAAAQPELAPIETGDEPGATVAMPREAAPEHEAAQAAFAEPAWTRTGDEPDATTALPRDAAPQPEPHAAAAEPEASAAPADAMVPEAAAVAPEVAATPEPAEPVVASEPPANAAEPPADPAEPPVEPTEHAPSPVMAEPADAAPQETTTAIEATPAELASAPPEAGHTDAASAPDGDPARRPRRAQPLIIESDTISGTVEEATAIDESEAPDIAFEADAEHEFHGDHDIIPEAPPPETVGGEQDSGEEQRERRMPPRFMRNYKIQEVIRRRQILLVQVVKEERGTKGAALTTYISLAGRFSVLMPNSPRGGGISRKITSAADRRRLKEVMTELEIPKGMGMIVRTAGANRPKAEIKRDCEYLLRLWDDIREHTLKSVAPALIYEEASLIKRAIRDVYSRDIDEIQVDGEDGWRAAHEFMRMLMPSHAKKVQLWRDPSQPLFSHYQVEAQLDGMLLPTVQLRSGGYLVINQTEALVAIDVNSGRSTRERGIEETALRTNLEAADEVARQLRLRDLAGLIVIDFIDMEAKKHNAMVERRIKEALKNDRARIQVGHISHFGLLEMSRQRLRPSLTETSFILCPHCGGTGHVRSTENAAIHVLRAIEEEGSKHRAAEIAVYTPTATALYILNHKRDRLLEIEARYAMHVTVTGDDTQLSPLFRIDRVRAQTARELPAPAITPDALPVPRPMAEAEPEEDTDTILVEDEADEEANESEETAEEARADDARAEPGETAGERAEHRRRRRRRRRGGRPEEARPATAAAEPAIVADMPEGEPPIAASETEEPAPDAHIEGVPEHAEPAGEDDGRGRRRGRRGGRRRGRREDGEAPPYAAPGADQPDLPPVYIGPTPANPFGGHAFDIFDVLEQAEANAAARPEPPPVVESVLSEPAAEAPVGEPEIMNVGAVEPTASEPKVAAMLAETKPAPEPPAAAEREVTNTSAPEPVATEPVTPKPAAEPAPAFAAPEAANDVTPEPAIKPIIIGSGEEPAERKRGWWRR